jgi:hypothetical protein
MAGVYVGTMWCLESSDAADDIYLITFRGNTTTPFASNVAVAGPGNFWDDFDAGEERDQDIPVAMFRPDAVYVVMLMDQDSGRDVAGDRLALWKKETDLVWKSMMGAGASTDAAAEQIKNAFKALTGTPFGIPFDPDDKMGEAQRLLIAPGQTPTLHFNEMDGEGRYKVRFKIK